MIIKTHVIRLGNFVFLFVYGTASRKFYIAPVNYNNKYINCKEYDTEFTKIDWFKQNFLFDSKFDYKITECFLYNTNNFETDNIELTVLDETNKKYSEFVNKESFEIFIKLLIYYYEQCKNMKG